MEKPIEFSQEKKFYVLFLSTIFIIFLNLVQILVIKNMSYDICLTDFCSYLFSSNGQFFGVLSKFQFLFPSIALFLSLIIIIYGNTQKIFTRSTTKNGLIIILILAFHLLLEIFQILPENNFNSTNYFLGMIEVSVTTFWLLSFRYQYEWHFKNKKLSIFDFWLISAFFLITLGIYISATGSSSLCSGFPVCANLLNLSFNGYLVLLHRIFAVIVAIVSLVALQKSWFYYRKSNIMLISTTLAFSLFIGQLLIGALQVIKGFPLALVGTHAFSAAAFFIFLVISVTVSKIDKRDESAEKNTIFNDKERFFDFVKLNKPIIVVLLLVTTFGGMVVGGGKLPNLQIAFWTLLAGGLAAGGSSAINQYIDRDIDQSMQRTSKRPIPSGRLNPSEALALGIAEIVFSFFIYTGFVNLLAGILAMIGMFYYVFIYSLWLKHITVQNIVIGGGAGAIPPLVGWAAATGNLNVPSLLLFGLIFLWTPPHFWALAIVRKNDYARANVPMMPVIQGEKKTRMQIFIYTIQLIILTLLMPVFKLGGTFFFISAIIFGVWLLHTAWQVLKKEGNKVAYKMYRYSSMYLVFIFLALSIDVFI